MYLKLLTSPYIERLKRRVTIGFDLDLYLNDEFNIDSKYIRENPDIEIPKIELILPDKNDTHDFENSKILFEALKNLNPTQATDYRIWTYMTHKDFWSYMRKRSPVESQPLGARTDYILTHWFIDKINSRDLMRNNISSLWWCAYLTYDSSREDPYELTKEVFSMLDYTRHLLPGRQGRSMNFTHALLEFVIENQELFTTYKAEKVRFLMRRSNFIAGYRLILNLSKEEIKEMFGKYKDELTKIQGR